MPEPVSATVAASTAAAATASAGEVALVAAAAASAGVSATATAFSLTAVLGNVLTGTLISAALSTASTLVLGGKKPEFSRGQTFSFRAPTEAANILYGQTRVSGPVVFMVTTGGERVNDNQLLWYNVALAGHEVEEIGDIYFGDEGPILFDEESDPPDISGLRGNAQEASTASPGGGLGQDNALAHCIKRLGRYDQAVNPNFVNTNNYGGPFHNLTYYGYMSEADTFKGIAHVSILLIYNAKLFPAGPPNVSAVVKGRKVYDPREPSHDIDDPETWEWTDNAALCLVDYMRGVPMHTGGGVVIRPYGVQATDDEIDWDYVIEAANICDESVQTLSGQFEKRYTCNGTIKSDVAPDDAVKSLLSAMAGYVAWTGGKWRVIAGAYRTPTATFDDDDQCGPSRTLPRRPRRDLFNGIKGKFKGPRTFYQPTDFPPVGGLKDAPTYVAEDNGEEIWREIELPFTTSASAAQRIARLQLQRTRQQIVTERRFKLSALGVQVGDTIALTDPRKGWSAKPFEVHKWKLGSATDEQGQPYLCIDMELHETSNSVYDWTADDEYDFDDAPDTNLPRPFDVAAPGAPGIVEELYQTRDGAGVRTRVTLSWADAFEGYFLDYIAEYKLASDSTWTVLPPVTSTFVMVNDLAAGIYDFRVKTRSTLLIESDYSTSMGLTVYGLGAAPQALTGLSIQPLGNQAVLGWDRSPDLDVREGGRVEVKHSPAFSGVTWENATSLIAAVPGGATQVTVPLKAGTYILRPVDSSDVVGAATSITSKQASINGYAALTGSPLTEESSFSGTHSFTVVNGGVLKLSSAGLWDDIADFDAESDIDGLGGQATAGTYTFANAYDFGAVVNARLTSKIAATITAAGTTIDEREEFIDDWEDFDGNVSGGQADAFVEYRQTDDDPAGSPTWTEWARLDTAEVECRAVECRVQLTADSPDYNIEITTLQVAAEELA